MTVDLDGAMAATQVLDEGELARLVAIGRQVEEAFGSPQDIEWALEGNELYVLQSRPITA
jgi:pyruvate,water dikinase